ncbi:hypothetical protein H4R99_001427 [Coemansia sp. RSA 1722]|nr:hypothetical protein LPJ57_000885 [Coemansia sp. RSA 486]KAJ2236775.1 hypothetical protein IWW45_001513 [Coemansia sp. RSA 485]KAJ2601659.1 hypothetical protein GGF39_001139 [Coemansia sp. RSA 1721]KAJ2605024.1 hypothetical protein H4R99_001427 [Coemansia sp. RSA 1722]KAJ2638932.1 hypothetical protein GGF40_001263 [Coemansia sp. RSA 1286]
MSALANDDSGSNISSGAAAANGAGWSNGDASSSSWSGNNSGSPLMQFTVPGGVNSDGIAREAIDVAVVSLARYTFADPALAARGPAPLEPRIESTRLLGVDLPPLASVGVRRISSTVSGVYEDDGLIAEFTEDRCNRQLSQLARRLLLPDSYVEACYDFIQFMEVNLAMFDVESVQRNIFKCLKICARLSKLHGYDIQLMWQVVQQAHNHIRRFTAERAQAIDKWHIKLTNRIRMMAVAPAADGSAPQRLPTVPPRELLEAQARERLLPLPEISISALNDSRFDRAAGVSSAEYYMSHSVSRSIIPVERSLDLEQGTATAAVEAASTVSELAARVQRQLAEQRGPSAVALLSMPTQDLDQDPQAANHETSHDEDHDDQQMGMSARLAGSETGANAAAANGQSASSLSTREAELAIIEHQLRELESMPAQSMGPMLRAALNLLVEMRFRLQLGLPRTAIAEGSAMATDGAGEPGDARSLVAGPVRAISRINSHNISNAAFGADANEENRVIEYVLNQISNTRRNRGTHAAAATGAGFGAPLYMMPHHMGMYHPGMRIGYGQSRETSQDSGPRGARRRRRRGTEASDSAAASEDYGRYDAGIDYEDDEEEEEEEEEEEDYEDVDNANDHSDEDGDEDDGSAHEEPRSGIYRRQQRPEGHVHRRLRRE